MFAFWRHDGVTIGLFEAHEDVEHFQLSIVHRQGYQPFFGLKAVRS
jgi:hypothetical protein